MKIHYFTDEFPDKDYRATTTSTHAQSKLWPAYLPVDNDRLFIFERSKNAQLVVYSANYAGDREQRTLDPKRPLDINWQSFGWTSQPTSNGTGVVERKMAWGYAHKALDAASAGIIANRSSSGSQFQITLNALPSRVAFLYFNDSGRLVLQTMIGNVASRLLKIFVCTANSRAFVPKVLYVELYGEDLESGSDTYERIVVAAS